MRQRAAVLFDVIGAGITGALVGIFVLALTSVWLIGLVAAIGAALLIGHETRVRS